MGLFRGEKAQFCAKHRARKGNYFGRKPMDFSAPPGGILWAAWTSGWNSSKLASGITQSCEFLLTTFSSNQSTFRSSSCSTERPTVLWKWQSIASENWDTLSKQNLITLQWVNNRFTVALVAWLLSLARNGISFVSEVTKKAGNIPQTCWSGTIWGIHPHWLGSTAKEITNPITMWQNYP